MHGPGADHRDVAAVLLDYGGTLDGDAAHWFDHFLAVYARVGRPIAPEQLKPAFYRAEAEVVAATGVRAWGLAQLVQAHAERQLAALGLDAPDLARRLADTFVEDTRRAWDHNRPLLRRLATRLRLGVVSNGYGNLPVLLAEADLGPFAVVLDSALVGLRKPDPAIYELAAARLALAPAAILHVGDSWERDVLAARAAGMRAAWLASPAAVTPDPTLDVWRLGSLGELDRLLG